LIGNDHERRFHTAGALAAAAGAAATARDVNIDSAVDSLTLCAGAAQDPQPSANAEPICVALRSTAFAFIAASSPSVLKPA
jgi:hypothetical protein